MPGKVLTFSSNNFLGCHPVCAPTKEYTVVKITRISRTFQVQCIMVIPLYISSLWVVLTLSIWHKISGIPLYFLQLQKIPDVNQTWLYFLMKVYTIFYRKSLNREWKMRFDFREYKGMKWRYFKYLDCINISVVRYCTKKSEEYRTKRKKEGYFWMHKYGTDGILK